MEAVNSVLGAITPIMLIFAGIFLSCRLGFFHILHPVRLIRAIIKKPARGGVSPFRSVTLALSGTLGVGNIVGVAGAIALGGFGAVFWMWVSAVCAAVLKYGEIALALSHRRMGREGPYGGAPYYIADFFAARSLPRLGWCVGAIFAAVCAAEVLSTGCGIQINAAAQAMERGLGVSPIFVGIFAAALTLYASRGGAETVSRLTVVLIPVLSLAYVLMSGAVIALKWSAIPAAFAAVLEDAFSAESLLGGAFGFFSSRALRFGAMRGLLSNEAGCGTAPFAHALSSTNDPAEQGAWGILEVIFDTLVLCTVTAAVIIVSYDEVSAYAGEPITMAIKAYSGVLGEWAEVILSLSVAAFGIATVVCCAHYGRECVRFLCRGRGTRVLFALWLGVYCAAAVVGAVGGGQMLWAISDMSLGIMTAINLPIICAFSGELAAVTKERFNNSDKNSLTKIIDRSRRKW